MLISIYCDLELSNNLITPYYIVGVKVIGKENELSELLAPINFQAINKMTLHAVKIWLRKLSFYKNFILNCSRKVTASEIQKSGIEYVTTIKVQEIVNYYDNLLENKSFFFIRSYYAWLYFLIENTNYLAVFKQKLTTQEKIAFLIARYFRLAKLNYYNYLYPHLSINKHRGYPSLEHLERLFVLDCLPLFYIRDRVFAEAVKHKATNFSWFNKQLIQITKFQ